MTDRHVRGARPLGLALLACVVLWTVAGPAAPAPTGRSPAELTNFRLSPERSQWLVGPIAWIATDEEIDAYLGLADDGAADRFVEAFWSRRSNPESPWPTDQPRAVFERRAAEADRLYTEGTRLGRRTARGTVYVLYGPPEDSGFEVPDRPARPRPPEPVEVWSYAKNAEPGLDGEKPKRRYYFVRRGEVTEFRTPPR